MRVIGAGLEVPGGARQPHHVVVADLRVGGMKPVADHPAQVLVVGQVEHLAARARLGIA